jgi:hypothetical protein
VYKCVIYICVAFLGIIGIIFTCLIFILCVCEGVICCCGIAHVATQSAQSAIGAVMYTTCNLCGGHVVCCGWGMLFLVSA